MHKFNLNIEGENVIIELSKHAEEQRVIRDVDLYEVEEAFLLAGERLLNIKVGKQFAIRKRGQYIIICQLYTEADSFDIFVEVITILGVNEPKLVKQIYALDV